ncbi:MAG: hypothetical protein E7458_00505 [Ruminococcaceae bacterium]|nr:hypothetical protein [Oscillospiraceae bacterium]
MTVKELAERLSLTPIVEAEPDREVTGGYTGDLLSWVMGRAQAGDAWVTIMTNSNIVAVATLADTAVIVLSEGVMPEEDVIAAAKARGINLYGSELDSFRLSGKIAAIL